MFGIILEMVGNTSLFAFHL